MNLEERIENYWNTRSDKFNEIRLAELHSKNAAAWQHLLQKHLPNKKQLTILDIGTGTGFFAILLSTQGHIVTGIDMSSKMIFHAKQNAAVYGIHATFQQMNAEHLIFPDNIFDVVISRNLTWTLPDAAQAYKEWYRVLKSNGQLINFDANYGNTRFTAPQKAHSVHHGISKNLLNECDEIKNRLSISKQVRPNWDLMILHQIGFKQIHMEPNISHLVHKDTTLYYDGIPLFALYATK